MYIIFAITFFTAVSVFFIVDGLIPDSEGDILKKRLAKYFNEETPDSLNKEGRKERSGNKGIKYGKRLVSREFEDYVLSTGIKIKPNEVLVIWASLIIIPVIILTIVGVNILTVIAVAAISVLSPPLYLAHLRKNMREQFTRQLGEAMIIMSNAIRSGFSFQQSMNTVAADMLPPLSLEFAKTIREIGYGVSQEEALRNMGKRMKDKDLDLLIAAVLTTSQVGGNISDIMDTISNMIKERIRIKQEIKVLTASGRLSAMIIAGLPVALIILISILSPDYFIKFLESGIGKLSAFVAVTLEIIGFIVIGRIVDIKY